MNHNNPTNSAHSAQCCTSLPDFFIAKEEQRRMLARHVVDAFFGARHLVPGMPFARLSPAFPASGCCLVAGGNNFKDAPYKHGTLQRTGLVPAEWNRIHFNGMPRRWKWLIPSFHPCRHHAGGVILTPGTATIQYHSHLGRRELQRI